MKVTKRNGEKEDVSFDKILFRIKNLSKDIGGLGELTKIDPGALCKEVILSVYDGVSSEEIDELTARIAINMSTDNSEYADLASRVVISNMHKKTTDSFSEAMEILYDNKVNEENVPIVSEELITFVRANKEKLDSVPIYDRDYFFDYFGFKTLERSYLLKVKESALLKNLKKPMGSIDNKIIIERPQHLWLRVSIGIHNSDLDRIIETYNLMSQGFFTHATPTLFNSGTTHQQLSSCVHEDTVIFTVNRGSIKIKDVTIGDKVITHLGNVKPVTQLHSNPINDRDFFELSTHHSKPIRITGNHPVWAIDREHQNPRWIPVQNLNKDHYISIPKENDTIVHRNDECASIDLLSFIQEFDETASFECIKIEEPYGDDEKTIQVTEMIVFNDSITTDRDLSKRNVTEKNKSTGVQRVIWFTPIIAEFLGVLYRYGRILPGYTLILDEIYDTKLRTFCTQVIENYFTEDYSTQFSRITINSKFLGFVFSKLLGNKKWSHKLPEAFNGGWEKSCFRGLLDGLFGEPVPQTPNLLRYSDQEKEIVLYSSVLVDQIYQLGRSFGYDIYFEESQGSPQMNRGVSTIPSVSPITLKISDVQDKDENKIVTVKNETFMKVLSIEKIDAPEYVYNIGVADDHSYVAEGLVIKNCFLLYVEDSMAGIYKCLSDSAIISKHAGGIGICASDIRGSGSYIKGTNGTSEGIVKMLRVFNETSRYANQGGKRNGSIAIYLEPWVCDIEDFLELRKNSGDENARCRDLFYGLWVPDLFMNIVEKDEDWYLMTSNISKGLSDVYGEEFEELYWKYVKEGKFVKKIRARDLWNKILNTQIETGMPYMLYKDSVNKKSNQKNIGTIKSSNLCVAPETLILTDKGYFPIYLLKNQKVNVWNGSQFSEVEVQKTGENQELMTVVLSNGTELHCTLYHKFSTDKGKLDAKDLSVGQIINQKFFPVVLNGDENCSQFTPINGTVSAKLVYLENLIETRGFNDYFTLSFTDNDLPYLRSVLYLLQTMGCNPSITKTNISETEVDEKKNGDWTLSLDQSDLLTLNKLGLKYQISLKKSYKYNPLRVSEIKFTKRYDDTYCFTEPIEGMGVFNGMLTYNCAEILIVSNKDEYGTCNISTIGLSKYVEFNTWGKKPKFNFKRLYDVAKVMTINMNKVIDNNFYPVPETERSNLLSRPIAIGVQGLSNAFFKMRYPFESKEAKELNKKIFETIQYACLEASCELAKEFGSYSRFEGSPASQGLFQHNLCGITPEQEATELSGLWDWGDLRGKVIKHGLRNSLLTACPPTASTSQILGNYESFEPITSNFFTRSTLSGTFPVVNKYLVKDLEKLDLWDEDMKDRIIANKGSIQAIEGIPDDIKALYKIIWEIPQRTLIDMSADRSKFIDHTQSLNVYIEDPTISKLTSMHFHSWKSKLKTGLYYLRSRTKVVAEQFTVKKKIKDEKKVQEKILVCNIDNKECSACSG